MAKSSNKRKNGKRVVNNHAERLKRLQARDIVGLMVCNAVGTSEVKGDRNELTPRTCVYSLPKRNITTITSRQAQALKEQRWAWNIQFGIVCRKPDGEVYLEQEENAQRITTNEGNIASNTAYIKAVEAKLPAVKAGDNTTVNVTVDAYGKATYTVSSKDFQPAIDANTAKIADNAKAISTNTADIRSAEKLIDKNAKDIAQNTSDIRDNTGKIADNANNIADNAANITHNSARINAVEIEAKKHSVVKAGKNTTVNKTTGENGEAVYTVDANVDHLATKAEVNKHVGAINSRIDGVDAKVNANTKAIHRLDQDLKKNRKRADAGTASVAAMANIPQVYLPGKSGVGVGVGYKHGQSAIAVGYSRTSDNAHHIIKLSVGADSQKDVTVGAGYMYQW